MKKSISILALVLFAVPGFGSAAALSGDSAAPRFSLRISAGYGSAGFGDLAKAARGHNDRLSDLAALWGFTRTGELGLPHQGCDLQAELIIHLSKRLGVGLGLGRLSRSGESVVAIEQLSFGARSSILWEMKASVVPLTLDVVYDLRLSTRLDGYLKAGLGVYFADLTLLSERSSTLLGLETWSRWSGEGHDYRLGWQASLGLEQRISEALFLFAEGGGRFVDFKKWSVHCTGGTSSTSETSSATYYWIGDELNAETGNSYPVIYFSDEDPAGVYIRNTRRAVIDFSGWSVRAGFRIRLR